MSKTKKTDWDRLEMAADALVKHLRKWPWLLTVGAAPKDGGTLFAYVTSKSKGAVVPDKWNGYKVIRRYVGKMRQG